MGKGGEDFAIPVGASGKLPIHYYRADKEPEIFSVGPILSAALDCVRGKASEKALVRPEEFKERVVIVGASAVGLEDLKATPIRSAVPGSLIHAAAISNILTQDFLKIVPPCEPDLSGSFRDARLCGQVISRNLLAAALHSRRIKK